MSEPKYDEDLVNLGYLKRVISDTEEGINIDFKNVSRHYGSQPIPPYYEGDTWVDGNIVYTCINTRLVGSYTASDWVTESGALQRADNKSKVFLTQPSNYKPGDMWILQSDNDHRAGKKGEILITTAGRAVYDSDDWVNMLGYGTIRSINEVADNLNNAITRIGVVEEAIEDGIIITFYQAEEPEGVHIGDLWYVTGEVTGYTEGKIYRYNGSTWDLLNDPAIQQAFTEANNARLVADGKIQSFYSASEPTTGDIGVGDLWIDTDDNNKLYRYNGTNWVACYDTRIDDMVETVEETTERVTSIETDLGEIDMTVSETTTRVTTLEGAVDNIKDTTGQAEGKYIYLDDASNELITSAKFNGETSQATRSGKNLAKNSSFTENLSEWSLNGLSNSNIETKFNQKCLHIQGALNTTKFISQAINDRVEAGETYTISCMAYLENYVAGTTNPFCSLYFDGKDTNNNWIGSSRISGSSAFREYTYNNNYVKIKYTFKVPNNADLTKTYGMYVYARDFTGDLYVYNLQLEQGSENTDYEAYGVSPSPDYPSEIENLEGRNIFDEVLENGGFDTNGINGANAARIRSKNYIPIKENTSYTISVGENNTGKILQVSMSFYDTNDYVTPRISHITWTTITNGVIFTTPANCKYMRFLISYTDSSAITINDNFNKFMIKKGTDIIPYAPYNSLEVKVVNKNLLDYSMINTPNLQDNGYYKIAFPGNKQILNNRFKENTQYTLSFEGYRTAISSGNAGGFNLVYTDGTSTNIRVNTTNPTKQSITSTPNKTISYVFITWGSTNETYIKDLMLEVGTQVTTCEEHKEQTVYFPLAEGQKLYEGSYLADDGIHNVRGQVILDGSNDEDWTVYAGSDAFSYTYIVRILGSAVGFQKSLCSHFKNVNYTWVNTIGKVGQYCDHPSGVNKYFNTDKSTLALWKAWLQSNPITVEYQLAEEEIIPYNTEQQAAWNNIKSLHTYKTVTHIYSDAYAEIGYIKDNGLDIYETKHEASRKYIETTEKFAQQKITNESIENTVSQTVTTVANNYNELKTKFDDYAPKSDVITLQTSVNQIMTDTYTKTEINEKLTDGSVTKVSTTAGTFDSNGLTIEKTDAKTKGNFNHEGIKVIDTTSGSNQELLFAGYDEEINETIVRTNNLTVNKYFTLKNVSRQEKYVNPVLGGKGIGTFIL